MTRKKRGFWTFCFSLIPGAGEMYLGFMKRGVSMMCLFLGWFAFCGVTGFSIGMCLLPVMWFYSFFQVHNLVSLPDEEFYQQEDDYLILHMDKIVYPPIKISAAARNFTLPRSHLSTPTILSICKT